MRKLLIATACVGAMATFLGTPAMEQRPAFSDSPALLKPPPDRGDGAQTGRHVACLERPRRGGADVVLLPIEAPYDRLADRPMATQVVTSRRTS